ncbi:Nicotinic acid mononucleotide adenylyltransferase [Caloramator fervidus]|uniref:Nicotinic acid mononucleotide adenylyltransferase n=1 Tax=Caloramator fervidus TaxID=29344 RepID=A0A1H5X002_9CLOT|nr:cytidyltransferase [Caloramator fervidus]SEG04873.1 Nicotinic acid mononucleotide adenylyltransferase [Caloramator fervidus]
MDNINIGKELEIILRNYNLNLNTENLLKTLEKLIAQKKFTANQLFNETKEFLSKVGPIPDNFLNYLYEYTLSKSFKNAVTIELCKDYEPVCEFFLKVFSIMNKIQKQSKDNTWQSKFPLIFLKDEDIEEELKDEYKNFVNAFEKENIYELMKLHKEITQHNTLDHICGVHHLALFIGRQIKEAGLPISLAKISGAAAGHDIGKFGCRPQELKKLPYLHYYYTDIWFKKNNISYIGHIAVNHSTWDLELENLPIESLILIYSDFRVKNKNINNKNEMHIFSLAESFNVILEKLDNLDEKKEKRYKKVYAKLKDFEDYLINLGINVDPYAEPKKIQPKKINYSLLQGNDITNHLKFLAIYHNINLMHKFRSESSLNSILEAARSLNNKNNLREYLDVFEEYYQYLTQHQKILMLKFLYDEMINPEDDIRRQCAQLIGTLIATFDEEYRKEVPEDVTIEHPAITSLDLFKSYVKLFLNPDERIIELHKEWLGYNFAYMLNSLFKNLKESQIKLFKNILKDIYTNNSCEKRNYLIYLINAVKYIPIEKEDEAFIDFLINMLYSSDKIIQLASLDTIYELITKYNEIPKINEISNYLTKNININKYEAEEYLKIKILLKLGINIDFNIGKYEDKISQISLSNLKTATNWILKKIQIDFLYDFALNNLKSYGLYIAIHFCNILKVSAYESVRNKAGETLVKLIPHLTMEQRNDIVVELLRALEIEGYQFTKYIPEYLGQIILYLKPNELDEVVDDFKDKIKGSGSQINILLLKTIGISIINYFNYKINFYEDKGKFQQRLNRLLGFLMNGLVHYKKSIKRTAMNVIGKIIFENSTLSYTQKLEIFMLIAKKLLTLIPEDENDDLQFFSNAASLNHIYRFISDYTNTKGEIVIKPEKKIAFFPGSFDPFSLSHKEIAKAIRDLGFTVYLQVDEFSWSKQTLPNLLRRNIINLSIADELNIYLFPEDIPINIANLNDLKKLLSLYPNSEIYLTVGSDVILNASAYKVKNEEFSIFDLPHIVFERRNLTNEEKTDFKIYKKFKNIIRLSLPPQYEDISSTQIRNYIDQNKDISALVDPLAEKYIFEYGLYRREPRYKSLIKTVSIEISYYENFNDEFFNSLLNLFKTNKGYFKNKLTEISKKNNVRFLIIKDIQKNKILAFSAFHWVRNSSLYLELNDSEATEFIRQNAVGRIIMIDALYTNKEEYYDNIEKILLTETLTFCIAKDYDYAIYKDCLNLQDEMIYETLQLYGFVNIPNTKEKILAVNMNSPCTINLDIENFMKEPFKSNKNIKKAINATRKKLLKALVNLYPGHLLLPINMDIIHEKLIRKICNENNVPLEPQNPKQYGPYMCVPFGNFLNRLIVPNTVTKSLHTEKFFAPDIKNFKIKAYPYYLEIENQIKVIKSFNRPVILIDDILHKGYRIKALDPLLKKENINVHKIIVGILSGKGKEIMDIQNRNVDCVYFIPKLRHWFNENLLYPYIGGDILWRGEYPKRNLIPSINLILPYAFPTFIKGASTKSIYQLSKTCLENSYEILKTIEVEYEVIRERNLTLSNLGDVFISPRCPDHGKDVNLDLSLSPCHYLENDLELLKRMEDIINRT